MKRQIESPRVGYEEKVKQQGLLWPQDYWLENASYRITGAEQKQLETMAEELWPMFLAAAQRIVDEKLYGRFAISESVGERITDSWNAEPPAIYGRYDIAWNNGVPKLLEFNADTPTGLVESAVCQWEWKQDKHPSVDQWNNIHDYLIEKWKDVKGYTSPLVHFTCLKDALYEDWMTTAYMQEVATQAGHQTKFIAIDEMQYGGTPSHFQDLEGQKINSCFKLYPWEWLINENPNYAEVNWIEPIWKMLFSNKEMLVVLSEMYPGHRYLLNASQYAPTSGKFVRKAKLGREGHNVTINDNGNLLASKGGNYGAEGFIYQDYADLGNFDGNIPVLGLWAIDGTPAGLGIRESSDLITGNTARFVPHLIEG